MSSSDQSLISLAGLDFHMLHLIQGEFTYFFNSYLPYSKDGIIVALDHHESACPGWPTLMTAYYGLGLVLTWTRTHGLTRVLQMLYYLTF